jgi:hypothetical protein
MIYFVLASLVYSWIAVDLVQGSPPMTLREAIGAALLCAGLATFWPPVLLWRLLLGPESATGRMHGIGEEDGALHPGLRRHQPSA